MKERILQIISSPEPIWAVSHCSYRIEDGEPCEEHVTAHFDKCPITALVEIDYEDGFVDTEVFPLVLGDGGYVRVDNDPGFLGFSNDKNQEAWDEAAVRSVETTKRVAARKAEKLAAALAAK